MLNDLHMIYKLDWKEEDRDNVIPQDSTEEEWQGNNNDCQPSKKFVPVLNQDLNCLPYEEEEEEEDESELPDNDIDVESLPGLESMLSVF